MKETFAAILFVLFFATTATAQTLSATDAESDYLPAYGLRAGVGHIFHIGQRGLYEAFYDVPFGGIFLSNELDFYAADNFAYGFSVKVKKLLLQRGVIGFYADAGFQFMVWLDKAHAGIPVDLSVTIDVGRTLQLEGSLNYTPLFFLGGEPGSGLTGVFAGIRMRI